MVMVVSALWIVVVGGAALSLRPVPARVPPSKEVQVRDAGPDYLLSRGRSSALSRRVQSLSRLRRRQIVMAVPAAFVGLLVWPALAPLLGLGAWAVPIRHQRRLERARKVQIRRELPDVIDVFALAASVGLNLRLAVEAVASEGSGAIVGEFAVAVHRSNQGVPLVEELGRLVDRLGDELRPLIRVLSATDLSAVETQTQLHVIGLDARLERRRIAEIEARRVPVRLLFPLVLCVLPAFGLLTVVPIIVGSFRSFAA